MRSTTVAVLGTLVACGAMGARGAELKLLGAITGHVRNVAGVGQMGATVVLMNRYERVVQRAFTSPDGRFRFDSLSPDTYTVRATLASFVPAQRVNVPVRAGMESLLNIQMANLFSSIELVYTAPGQTGLLSEDWKWVLRGSTSTRPVLRALPTVAGGAAGSAFSATSGMVRVSAGDGGVSTALGSEPDLGTAFALATSLFGTSELRVSGNIGYASAAGTPTAGFRTSYSRAGEMGTSPEVELTVRQASLRQRVGVGVISGQDVPLLRTMSLKVGDKLSIGDDLTLQYGATLEAVVFLEQLNLLSPFARLTYDLGEAGVVEAGFSSGAPAMDLIAGTGEGVQDELVGLAMFPRVSLRDGRARVQKNETFEVGYRKVWGSRTYAASMFQDSMRDSTVMVGGAGVLPSEDLLPDLASSASVFNVGRFRSQGYSATVAQALPGGWTATLGAGSAGMLTPVDGVLESNSAEELRSSMRAARRVWATARVGGVLPGAGTRVMASYLWTPAGSMGPTHAFLTQRWQPQMGLNLQVRQPIPGSGVLPGRLEATAELRNLLAQGYLPFSSLDGRRLYLIQFPRTVRGGVSFIF